MITRKNYNEIMAKTDRSKFDASLQEMAGMVDQITEHGTDWSGYDENDRIREIIDEYFRQLNEFLSRSAKKSSAHKTSKSEPESEIIDHYGKKPAPKPRQRSTEAPKRHGTERMGKRSLRVVKRPGKPVELISEELRFIKRYTLLNGKVKNRDQIRLFINALQRAMTEKRIRKSSPYAKDILDVQDSLIELYNVIKGNGSVQVAISPAKLNRMLSIVGSQELMTSVRFIKSYIGLQGKTITGKQATNLYNRITRAIDYEQLVESDPYWNEVTDIHTKLKTFVKKHPEGGVLIIPERELNGLSGIPGVCDTGAINGITTAPKNLRMNSMDFVQMKFDKIGFTGKWLDFFGNPSKGFSVLVSGPPKFGKSIMSTSFAGYLARNHGRVLYVAREEGLDDTLKEKLEEVAHPNLEVQDYFDGDVHGFDFVFLDSITRLHLSPDEINRLRDANPGVSFIFISQVTKAGKARGSNEFAHDVDCIVEFPEIGRAVQYGRFNQGGTMNIFS